jgi:transcriptional regulator with XRE-family HTH domain
MCVIRDEPHLPWPPPRGPRPPKGVAWPALTARKANTYTAGDWAERDAVKNYRDLIEVLYIARADRQLSMRALADAAGIAVSGVNAMETGSAWPRLNTLRTVARAVNLELHIDGDPDVANYLLRHVRRKRGLSLRDVAIHAGLRSNTVSELKHPARSPSTRTVLGVAAALHLQAELRPTPG